MVPPCYAAAKRRSTSPDRLDIVGDARDIHYPAGLDPPCERTGLAVIIQASVEGRSVRFPRHVCHRLVLLDGIANLDQVNLPALGYKETKLDVWTHRPSVKLPALWYGAALQGTPTHGPVQALQC